MNSSTAAAQRDQWVLRCSARLRVRWRLDAEERNEIAEELWDDERWGAMPPEEAAEAWLRRGVPDAS